MHTWTHSIRHHLKQGESPEKIVSRVYETYPARAFEKLHGYDIEFEIKRRIADELNVAITSVLICGSAQIGESIHAGKPFDAARSDLDIAVVDKNLFIYLGLVAQTKTKDFQDLTSFPKLTGIDDVPSLYKNNYCRGFIHTFTLPSCEEKRKISDLFSSLTKQYVGKFTSISGSVYSTLQSFERKQAETVRLVK
ncbi:hypothetical protein CHU94_06225 [Rhodoferax sp. TH121]|nr:hypothetical protein CHU94_06225 [Rhodoferax sp. TH121]